MKRILLVDDEPDILEFLTYNLKAQGYEVITALDGVEALQKLIPKPDLIILDIMMPKMDGYEVCAKIRENDDYTDMPIVFLTARSSEKDEIKALELGAADFIAKPISPSKFIARVKANLRKYEKFENPDERTFIEIGPVKIDRLRYVAHLNGTEIIFPRKEFELLFYLAGNPGKVHKREDILKNVWGSDVFVIERTIDVHIRKIREKLGSDSDCIETLKGVGYRFKEYL